MSTKIFFTGATGYIGGSVLNQLLEHKNAKSFEITAFVRSPDKARLLESLGLRTVLGSNSDLDILSKVASEADVVIACANADDLEAAQAILAGMEKYHERTGKRPSLIHTSGTGVLSFESHGAFASDHVYSDLDIPMIEKLPNAQPHREVDVTVVQADADGYVDTYIVLPSTIYGRTTGVLVDWVAALFILIFDLALAGGSPPAEFEHGRAGFYFGANGEHSMLEISKAIAKFMHGMGMGTNEPTPLSLEEMKRFFPSGRTSLSTNSRCTSDRGKAIGWKPVKTSEDILASIEVELKAFAAGK